MEILIIFFIILINGFFALSEIAFVTSSRDVIESCRIQGNTKAALVLKMMDEPDIFLSSIQVGITLVGIMSGAIGALTLAHDLSDILTVIPYVNAYADQASIIIIIAAVTYFFSQARNWARIASLILFVLNLLGGFELSSLFSRAPIAGGLYLSELLLQALAMYLAFATPASNAFQNSSGDDPEMRAILPIGRSGWAIAAGYLALISILLVPAPFALATGLLAIRDIRRHPEKHGMGRAIFGIVMGALGVIAMLALVGFRMTR